MPRQRFFRIVGKRRSGEDALRSSAGRFHDHQSPATSYAALRLEAAWKEVTAGLGRVRPNPSAFQAFEIELTDARGGGRYMSVETARIQTDPGGLVRRIRSELSGSDRPVTQERLSELLGVSWSTVARWEGGQEPAPSMAHKLVRLEAAIALLGDLVHPDDRVAFFEERHPLLLEMRPIDLLDTKEGMEALERVIEGVRSGAFQ